MIVLIDPKLQTFISLCETKSYTKTAELLYVTQPSVTHHIKTLEKTYNIRLFTSNNKNFRLTPQGELLYNYAVQLLAFDNEFERMLEASLKGDKVISFAATPNVMNSYLKDIIPIWAKNNRDLFFKLTEASFEEIHTQLLDGKIDFAIVDNCFNRKSFQVNSLFKSKLVLAVNKNHELASHKKVNFDTLLREKLIIDTQGSGKREFFENELKFKNRSIKEFKNLIEVANPKTIVDLVIAGAGVAVFYESEIADEIRTGKLVSIDLIELKNTIEFSLIYNKNHLASKMIENIGSDFEKIYKEINYLKYTSSFK